MNYRARGTFEVKVVPLENSPAPGIARLSLDKQFHGDLEGVSKGEMLSAGSPTSGSAGYMAMEVVSGKLNNKSGTFALQHSATMDAGKQQMNIVVAPGSGTGELAGLSGNFVIIIADGKHSYEFEYNLPEK